MVTRYEFLDKLHTLLQPRGYLEIGVQTGASLVLAKCPAIGIDPNPMLQHRLPPTSVVVGSTSDAYFEPRVATGVGLDIDVDLAFIDGMHLAEYAFRDFAHIQRFANERTVVVFDDVLPYDHRIANRAPLAGDWTGDVWRVVDVIREMQPMLDTWLVDSWPTGLFVVTNLNPNVDLMEHYHDVVWDLDIDVPDHVIARHDTISPENTLTELLEVLLR